MKDNLNTKFLKKLNRVRDRLSPPPDDRMPRFLMVSTDDWERRNYPFTYFSRRIWPILFLLVLLSTPYFVFSFFQNYDFCSAAFSESDWERHNCREKRDMHWREFAFPYGN